MKPKETTTKTKETKKIEIIFDAIFSLELIFFECTSPITVSMYIKRSVLRVILQAPHRQNTTCSMSVKVFQDNQFGNCPSFNETDIVSSLTISNGYVRYASKKCEKEGKLNIKRRKICPSGKLNKRNMNVLSLEGIIVMDIFLILF